jgi:hypothetical protein
VLDDSILTDATPNSDKCELIMGGYFVKLSDRRQMSKVCGDKPLSAIRIYAHNIIFIDESLEAIGEELLVGFAAPKWEVIGNLTINLNGANGEGYDESVGDGKAGGPGGPSGLFFGIADDIVSYNRYNLKITANGGTGGDGQNGRNGTDGHGDIDIQAVYNLACDSNLYNNTCNFKTSFFRVNNVNY